jgi:hypothetical protein
MLLPDYHPGFIDWATYQANQTRIDANVHPQPHQAAGALREGTALLQGLATCGSVAVVCIRIIAGERLLPAITAPAKISSRENVSTGSTSVASKSIRR